MITTGQRLTMAQGRMLALIALGRWPGTRPPYVTAKGWERARRHLTGETMAEIAAAEGVVHITVAVSVALVVRHVINHTEEPRCHV